MSKQTVTINGVVYDAHTGMPVAPVLTKVAAIATPPSIDAHRSQSMHKATQKSQTLNRRIVRKTAPAQARPATVAQKSSAITKFAPHPSAAKKTPGKTMSDIGPVQHPMVAKATQHMQTQKAGATPKPSNIIKQEAISKALHKAPSHAAGAKQHKPAKRYPRVMSIATASFALLLLGGYFTYLNMPSLSVRVAAAQAGVNASYPEYRPDGYSLNGPVGYTQGEVTMKFAANAGPQNFTVTQEKSGWDSSAVLDNYVKQKAGDNYITYSEHGLTIYTFDGNAAWVNGGILYKIDGNAPLSSDQVRHIATSM
jgi:hypothetical protein